jgi:hypothetical protein
MGGSLFILEFEDYAKLAGLDEARRDGEDTCLFLYI